MVLARCERCIIYYSAMVLFAASNLSRWPTAALSRGREKCWYHDGVAGVRNVWSSLSGIEGEVMSRAGCVEKRRRGKESGMEK